MSLLLSGYGDGRQAPSLQTAVGAGRATVQEALDSFRHDYAPVLRILVPRRRARRAEPQSPFLKQR
ncbi:MAG TPA: hypothetical protein VGG39_00600 [Polyangiaceae bacterium]|jgi:hypothetical protein